MRKKLTCVLLVAENEELNKKAIAYARKRFLVKGVINFRNNGTSEKKAAALKPDYVFNFLSDKILKGPLLKFNPVNFHPAPPEWPGRGSASYALFHNSKFYGAVAHIIEKRVDAGKILLVKRFPIYAGQPCEEVFRKGKEACLVLFKRIVDYAAKYDSLPPACGERWRRKSGTRKEFQKWLILNPKNKNEFIRKIKASQHSKFPGPYVVIHGHKFGLINKD